MASKRQLSFDELDTDNTPDAVDEWIGPPPNRRKPVFGRKVPKVQQRQVEAHIAEAMRRTTTREWDDATPNHLVGLYVFCHHRVYGSRPVEVGPDNWNAVASMAGKQLRDHFKGDVPAVVEFMRWVWDRERNRRDYLARRARELDGKLPDVRRISWWLQFNCQSPLLTDYTVSLRDAR